MTSFDEKFNLKKLFRKRVNEYIGAYMDMSMDAWTHDGKVKKKNDQSVDDKQKRKYLIILYVVFVFRQTFVQPI